MILIFFLLAVHITGANITPCIPGQYLSAGQCRRCLMGSYCPDGVQQLLCAPGNYTDMYQQTKCRQCPPGHFNIQPGSKNCTRAQPGQYAPVNNQNFLLCPPGTYTDRPGQSVCRSCRPERIVY